jgi:hypothetical protein
MDANDGILQYLRDINFPLKEDKKVAEITNLYIEKKLNPI